MPDPYEWLDGGARPGDDPVASFPEPGWARALARGLRKRCPRCGDRDAFETYFQLHARCPRCGLRFEQEDGGFLGAMTLNYLFAITLWLVVLGIWLIVSVPDVPVGPILIVSIVLLAIVPVWSYPRSKMAWAAVEYLVARTDPDYRTPAPRDPRARDLE